MLTAVIAVSAAALLFVLFLRGQKAKKESPKAGQMAMQKNRMGAGGWCLLGAFVAVLASQIVFLILQPVVYLEGDMTVETVASFLESNAIYKVNPLTGQAYTQGLPLRIQILGLPTLYGALADLFSVPARLLVAKIVPVAVLLIAYAAFATIGVAFFGKEKRKVIGFLLVVAALFWAGSYAESMDGFALLYCGYRATTIRNTILVPWTVSLCMRGKWLTAFLAVAAEACITWTLYGMGVCLLVVAVMGIATLVRVPFLRRQKAGEEGAR
jgi:hypothetical protein